MWVPACVFVCGAFSKRLRARHFINSSFRFYVANAFFGWWAWVGCWLLWCWLQPLFSSFSFCFAHFDCILPKAASKTQPITLNCYCNCHTVANAKCHKWQLAAKIFEILQCTYIYLPYSGHRNRCFTFHTIFSSFHFFSILFLYFICLLQHVQHIHVLCIHKHLILHTMEHILTEMRIIPFFYFFFELCLHHWICITISPVTTSYMLAYAHQY